MQTKHPVDKMLTNAQIIEQSKAAHASFKLAVSLQDPEDCRHSGLMSQPHGMAMTWESLHQWEYLVAGCSWLMEAGHAPCYCKRSKPILTSTSCMTVSLAQTPVKVTASGPSLTDHQYSRRAGSCSLIPGVLFWHEAGRTKHDELVLPEGHAVPRPSCRPLLGRQLLPAPVLQTQPPCLPVVPEPLLRNWQQKLQSGFSSSISQGLFPRLW